MNLRSPGSISRRTFTPRSILTVAGLVFALAFVSVGDAAGAPTGLGVKVKPKVTIVAPKEVKGDVRIVQYPVPARYATPYGIAVDSKDNIWCTLMSANSLVRLDPSKGEFKEYRIPSTEGLPESDWKYDSKNRTSPDKAFNVYSVGSPGNVIVGKNDIVWFVMHLGNSVVRFDPVTEEMTEFLMPTKNAQPYDLAEDPRGRIWFVEKNGSKFGVLDVAKKTIAEIPLPAGSQLMGIAVDTAGVVWLSEVSENYIGRYEPETKKYKKFPIPAVKSQPGKMQFGKEGMLWFCLLRSKQIGVLYTDKGMFGLTDPPGYNTAPQAITAAKDGYIWYIDSMMNAIGYFDQKSVSFASFDLPSMGAQPMSLSVDSKGDVWFTESDRGANQISMLIRSSVPKGKAMPHVHEAPSGHSH